MGTVIDRHLRVIDELMRLERANVLGALDTRAYNRRLELTRGLFGPAPGQERRRYFRLQTHHLARILDLGEGQIAHVTSLGLGGLFLQLDWVGDALMGQALDLELFLPLDETSPVRCRVRACRRAPDGIGVAFVELSGEVEHLLLRYVKQRLLRMGRVAASVAHDIDDPLAHINQNLSTLHTYVEPVRELIRFARDAGGVAPVSADELDAMEGEIDVLVEETLEGGRRIQDIVEELRSAAGEDDRSLPHDGGASHRR
jgi:hypothetical protein